MDKTTDPTAAQFAAFRAMYDYFNAALFAGRLCPVILNFSRAANSLGFFAPERWKNGSATSHEISLNPAYLAVRDPREVVSTLVHEMAHCWQEQYGTPGRRGYHNEEWARKMDELGLAPSSTAAPGGARVGYRMSHWIVEGGAFAIAFAAMPGDFLLPWVCWEGQAGTAKKKRGASKVKFTCPGCDSHAWGRPTLSLDCGECKVAMVADGATDGDAEERCAA